MQHWSAMFGELTIAH